MTGKVETVAEEEGGGRERDGGMRESHKIYAAPGERQEKPKGGFQYHKP